MLDLVIPASNDLDAAVKAIDALKPKRPTLVCCALGYSRSAMVIAAWLIANQVAPSVDSAIRLLRKRRHRIVLHEAHRGRLEEWARSRGTL
jgi:protein-tyrosine phosphatase